MVDYLSVYCDDKKEIYKVYNTRCFEKISEKRIYNSKSIITGYIHQFKFHNLLIVFKLDKRSVLQCAYVKGSLHYLFNDGLHNANNFSYKDLKETLDTLTSELKINLEKWQLKPFEYGLNIQIPFNVDDVVFNTFSEQKKLFLDIKGNSRKSGDCRNDYSLKHYNKYFQFKDYALKNTMRLELKVNKTRWYKNIGIKTLKDLYSLEYHKRLINKHIEYLNQVIVYDALIEIDDKNKFYKYSKDYSNINFWRKQIKISKLNSKSKLYNTHFKRLKRLSKEYGCDMWNVILMHVRKRYNELLGEEYLQVVNPN